MKIITSSQQYFNQYSTSITACSIIKAEYDAKGVFDNIYSKIKNGIILVKQIQDQINLQKRKNNIQQNKEKLHQIRVQKMEIMKQLDVIDLEESKIRDVTNFNTPKSRILISQDDKVQLKKLTKAHKNFEKSLQKKDQQIKLRVLSIKNKEQEAIDTERKNKNKERSQEAKVKIEQIKARSIQRKIKNEETDKLIFELKNQKHLFKQMEERWNEVEDIEQRKITELKAQLKKSKQSNIDGIKQHEKRYEQILQKQKDQRQQKLDQINSMEKKIREWLPAQSSIFKNMKFHEQVQNKQSAFKSALPKIYKDRKKQYAQMVKENFLPQMKVNQSKVLDAVLPPRSMSTSQLYQKGNEYLEQARKVLRKNNSKQKYDQTHSSIAPSIVSCQSDYLKQQRSKHRKPQNQIQKLASLIKGEQLKSCEKVQKTKEYIEIVEPRLQKDPKKLIQLMNLKLSMLQTIQ